MKKFFLITIIFLVCVFAFTSLYHPSNKTSNKTRVFRIGTECDYPPNNWQEKEATDSNIPIINQEGFYAEGYDIQIAKLVAESMSADIEVRKIAWEDLIPALNRNEIDAIFSGMLDTSERKKTVDFSDVYGLPKKYGVMVHRDGKYSKAKKMTDFVGAKFVGQKNTNLDRGIYQLLGIIRLPAVATASEMLSKLLSHDADGIIVDSEIIAANENLYPEIIGVTFASDETFFFRLYRSLCRCS